MATIPPAFREQKRHIWGFQVTSLFVYPLWKIFSCIRSSADNMEISRDGISITILFLGFKNDYRLKLAKKFLVREMVEVNFRT